MVKIIKAVGIVLCFGGAVIAAAVGGNTVGWGIFATTGGFLLFAAGRIADDIMGKGG